MRVDWCVSSWFRIKNTHSHTPGTASGYIFLYASCGGGPSQITDHTHQRPAADRGTWSTWSAVSNLTPRTGPP